MDALLRRRLMMLTGGSPTPPGELVFYDRLVFDGVAYIETDIVPGANDSFVCIFGNESQKIAQRLFMCPAANATQVGAILNSSTSNTNRNFTTYYGASSYVGNNKTLAFSNAEFSFFLTPKRYGWGNAAYTFTKGANAPTGGLVIGSNAAHSGQPFTGNCSRFRLFGSDAQNCVAYSDFANYTPYATLRPCTYNGEAGLWCEETSKFYGNSAGAGALTVRNNS